MCGAQAGHGRGLGVIPLTMLTCDARGSNKRARNSISPRMQPTDLPAGGDEVKVVQKTVSP